jgi:acyl-coenzyme A thioesterase PaaI-like protein
MDYRRQLFQIERFSPRLAHKFWGIVRFFESPFNLAFGFKINHLSDQDVEVEIPFSIQNKNEQGALHTTVMLAAADYASRSLWLRHLKPEIESFSLESVRGDFLKEAFSKVSARAQLIEKDREIVLRKVRAGESTYFEMIISLTDLKKQNIGLVVCTWKVKLRGPLAIQGGM